MPRPQKIRCIEGEPGAYYFKPAGIPMTRLKDVELSLDEFEALRLADHESHSHEEAAAHMGVSRATFGRILASGRKKTAGALIHGKALVIEKNSALNINSGAESDDNLFIKCKRCGKKVGGNPKCKKNV